MKESLSIVLVSWPNKCSALPKKIPLLPRLHLMPTLPFSPWRLQAPRKPLTPAPEVAIRGREVSVLLRSGQTSNIYSAPPPQKTTSLACVDSSFAACMKPEMPQATGRNTTRVPSSMLDAGLVCPPRALSHHAGMNLRVVVHGGDCTFLGTQSAIGWAIRLLRDSFDIKVRGVLGPNKDDDTGNHILNRNVSLGPEDISIEADQRHAGIIIRDLGRQNMKGVPAVTPGIRVQLQDGVQDPELRPNLATQYRKIVARAKCLSLDRPDIQCAVKELSRDLSKPTRSSMAAPSRLGS